ncbi:MAG: NifU family protein [Bdellovibrionaceae bacterium]|jgi:NFU1 iron-sulfur cluster scaffold homolog, mitochondrial|nr:NifU family protein [Pseudobdellovibrionaceae bacterium]
MSTEFMPKSPEDVLIRVQQTPNPQALKFICNFPFLKEGKLTFKTAESAEQLELVQLIFQVEGVTQVFLSDNTMTVSFEGTIEEELFEDAICLLIKKNLPSHDVNIDSSLLDQTKVKKDLSELSPKMREVEEILDRTIRPGLQADGGDVEVVSFTDNLVEIMYQGACGGCPSAMMGTLDAIQGILQQELKNDNIQVRPIMEDYSMGGGFPGYSPYGQFPPED